MSAAPAPLPAADEPPLVFSVRLEGTTVRGSVGAAATSVNPGSGYTFAKIDSVPELGGGRGLTMKAVGAYGDPGDLGGAVLFDPAANPVTDGTTNFPTYADAFFPKFGGQSTKSQKCAANPRSEPSEPCEQQPGSYAAAAVEPEASAPRALGEARAAGGEQQGGEAKETNSTSEIAPKADGSMTGTQKNTGRNLVVPGTPITVESFLAQSTVVTNIGKISGTAKCTAQLSVGGQAVSSPDDLSAALEPFTTSTGVRVEYLPPTKAQIVRTSGGGVEASCIGARFLVNRAAQGVAVQYTYGRTFATAGRATNEGANQADFGSGGTVGAGLGATPAGPPAAPGDFGAPVPSTESDLSGGAASAPSSGTDTAASAQPAGEPAAGGSPAATPAGTDLTGGSGDEQAQGRVRRVHIDTMPLALATALAGTALPLGVWFLLGVTGSLARGTSRLRLPPFRDQSG